MKKFTFAQAVNEALHIAMKKDKKMLCCGLGVTDPKNIFSTTKNYQSENQNPIIPKIPNPSPV